MQECTPRTSISAEALRTDYAGWAATSLSLAEADAYPATLSEKEKPTVAYMMATAKIPDRQIALAPVSPS